MPGPAVWAITAPSSGVRLANGSGSAAAAGAAVITLAASAPVSRRTIPPPEA
jgi:hypothetical protein